MIKKFFPHITVLLSLVMTIMALELLLRVIGVDGSSPPLRQVEVRQGNNWYPVATWGTGGIKRQFVHRGEVGSEYIPDTDFRFVYFDHSERFHAKHEIVARYVDHSINADGYRGARVSKVKSADTYRLVFVGDSFTFGEGVPEGETLPRHVEGILNRIGVGGAMHCEVINGGVAGHNTSDESLDLERRWLAYDPDMVIIVFYLNDAYDDEYFGRLITGGAQGISMTSTGRVEPVSYLYSFLLRRWQRYRMSRQVSDIYMSQFSENPTIAGRDWADAKLALAKAKILTAERGIKLGLVIYPELFELTDDYPFLPLHNEVVKTAAALGIPTLDLLETFRGKDPEKLWVHVSDHHPNAIANKLAAEAVANFILDPRLGNVR